MIHMETVSIWGEAQLIIKFSAEKPHNAKEMVFISRAKVLSFDKNGAGISRKK